MTLRIFLVISVAAVAVCLGACSPLSAARQTQNPQVSWGEGVAKRNCGQCHAIGPSGRSELSDAPPFRDLRPHHSRAAMERLLRERMVETHPRMPALHLDDDELSAFLDYWQGIPAAGSH